MALLYYIVNYNRIKMISRTFESTGTRCTNIIGVDLKCMIVLVSLNFHKIKTDSFVYTFIHTLLSNEELNYNYFVGNEIALLPT